MPDPLPPRRRRRPAEPDGELPPRRPRRRPAAAPGEAGRSGSASRPRRRRQRANAGATVGFWLLVAITAVTAVEELGTLALDLSADEPPGLIDFARWTLTTVLFYAVWQGRNWARIVLCVLWGFVILLCTGLAVLLAAAMGAGGETDQAAATTGLAVLIGLDVLLVLLIATLCSPWVSAFMAQQRGE